MALTKLRNLGFLMSNPAPVRRYYIGGGFLPISGKAMVASWAKAGKSFTILELCKNLALAQPVFGHPLFTVKQPVRSLVIDHEVGEDGFHERTRGVFDGCDWQKIDEMVWAVSRDTAIKLDTELGVKTLDAYISEVQPNVVILDPISRLMDGDDSANAEVREVFDNIDKLMEKHKDIGLSFILVHHAGKPPDDGKGPPNLDHMLNPYRMRGASMWVDAPDAIMTMYREINFSPGWNNKCRLTLRHAEDIPDFDLNVNRYGMGAVYVGSMPGTGSPNPGNVNPRSTKLTQGKLSLSSD